jgi:hypothetical protein
MPNRVNYLFRRRSAVAGRRCLPMILATAVLILFLQAACSKKAPVPAAAASAIRVALLPFDTPMENQEFRWTAMAGPVLMAKASASTSDLEITPLWQTMSTVIASAGASRTFNEETAASTAVWLGAKWAVMGTIKPVRSSLALTMDFIPSKTNEVAFRYMKTRKMDTLEPAFLEAVRQFLRYQAARPVLMKKTRETGVESLKELAEALDREYGWFKEAEPGKAQEVVARLARTDMRLARLLFNPGVYPVLAEGK